MDADRAAVDLDCRPNATPAPVQGSGAQGRIGKIAACGAAGRFGRWDWALVGGMILLGVALRVHALGDKSLWGDEINTAVLFVRMPLWYITTHFHSNNHTLFSLLAHLLTAQGTNEFVLRYAAALFGTATIPATYALARSALDRRSGLIAALLLAISPYHVWFSQEARGYTGMVLFSTLSLLFLLRAIRRGARRFQVGFVVTTALSIYSHLFSVVILGAELVILAAVLASGRLRTQSTERLLRTWALSLLGLGLSVALLTAPLWLGLTSLIDPSYAGDYVGALGYRTDWTLEPSSFLRLALTFAGAWRGHWQPGAALVLGLFGMGLLAAIGLRRRPGEGASPTWLALSLAGVLVLPFALVALLSVLWHGFYAYSRFFVFMVPVFLCFAGHGITRAGDWLGWLGHKAPASLLRSWRGRRRQPSRPWAPALSCLLLVGIVGAAGASSLRDLYGAVRQDWQGVGQYLRRHVRRGDWVIQTWLLQPNSLRWYFQPTDGSTKVLRADLLRTTALAPAAGQDVWWVFVHDGQAERLKKAMGEAYDVQELAWLAVLHKKAGVSSPAEAQDATVSLVRLQSELSPGEQSVYQRLADDLLRQGGFELARLCVDRGNALADRGAWAEALPEFQKAVTAWPSWGLAHTKLGNALRGLGRLAEAEASYRRSIEVEPGYVGAHINLGYLLQQQGKGGEARAHFEQAVQVAPDSAWAHSALGSHYLTTGDSQKALAHLGQAVDLDPGNVTWLLALADACRTTGQSSRARELYQQILDRQPGHERATEGLRKAQP